MEGLGAKIQIAMRLVEEQWQQVTFGRAVVVVVSAAGAAMAAVVVAIPTQEAGNAWKPKHLWQGETGFALLQIPLKRVYLHHDSQSVLPPGVVRQRPIAQCM